MRRLAAVALAVVVGASLLVAGRDGGHATDADRAQRLTEQLLCPVCDGLAVADSPSSTARAIAADVRSRVAAGETDDDIRRAYVDQYGEWILLTPAASGIGAVVWMLPLGALFLAFGAFAWTLRRRAAPDGAPPTEAARALVAQALHDKDDES
jgi:cytochrome c-type biogenesis protein CcmH